MDPFVSQVWNTIQRHRLLESDERVLVAVSGGSDSCAMLLSLDSLKHEYGFELHVAYLDHGLRPGAADDARFVKDLADRLGVGCTIAYSDVRSLQKRKKVSPEHAARIARYEFLEETADSKGAAKIAIGHTSDDFAETVLLNLIRGTGLQGLEGIPLRRGRVVRPLLECSRDDARDFCERLGIAYLHDETNEDPKFSRNVIRHRVLPALRQIQPDVENVMMRMGSILTEENRILDELALAAMKDIARLSEREIALPRILFARHPSVLRRRILRCAIREVRGDLMNVEFHHVEFPLIAMEQGERKGSWTLPGGDRILLTQDEVIIAATAQIDDGNWQETQLTIPGTTELKAPLNGRIESQLIYSQDLDCVKLCDTCLAYVDGESVGSLSVRPPRAGDVFRPLGSPGSKKLHDFLIDRKVPRNQRIRTPIVVSSNAIVWVAGHRIDDRFKITKNSRLVLALKWIGSGN